MTFKHSLRHKKGHIRHKMHKKHRKKAAYVPFVLFVPYVAFLWLLFTSWRPLHSRALVLHEPAAPTSPSLLAQSSAGFPDSLVNADFGIFPALTKSFAFVRKPGATLFHRSLNHCEIEQITFTRNAFAIHDVELSTRGMAAQLCSLPLSLSCDCQPRDRRL